MNSSITRLDCPRKLRRFRMIPASRSLRHGWLALLVALHAAQAVTEPLAAEIPPDAPEETAVAEAPDAAPAAATEELADAAKTGFLRWMGEELAAPWRETAALHQAQAEALHAEVEQMREEMAGVRQELQELRETLDLLVREVIRDLRADNEELRDALAGAQTREEHDRRLATMTEQELAQTVRERLGPPPMEPAVELSLEILDEWGRNAEDVAQLGGNASTLKGIIGVVSPGAPLGALEQLGRDLRNQYDHFDNINIEIFDDHEAAAGFQANQVGSPAHRALTVSRHRASGQDSVVVYQNGVARQVQ